MISNNSGAWGKTHTGCRRKNNEDRYLIKELSELLILVVADGVGGSPGGGTAAQIVIDTFKEYGFSEKTLKKDLRTVLEIAKDKIHCKIIEKPEFDNMGTTVTAAIVFRNKIFWTHVGDSRMYLLHNKKLRQITTDHTFIQDLIDDGTLTLDQAKKHPFKNMLEQCLGCDEVKPDNGVFEAEKNDCLLLCSDGLTAHLSDLQVESILKKDSALSAGPQLLNKALKMGGIDNITMIIKNF